MSEDSKNLDSFLRFCHPSTLAEDPPLGNLTDALPVLAFASKFERERASSQPPGKHCSNLKPSLLLETPSNFAEVAFITAFDFLALLIYRKTCSIVVQSLANDLSYDTHGRVPEVL
ncbi:hypothetical protein DEU56DRAFT_916618 [Suillus clintonianus]|uniref:uncharacterized protein n=1 Tax=Suillus clintonianus TaxID=1904413 RepID=UPI001B86DEC9|nr:uncharacterized protein DEU56DRAFT_916618 [Suillus clintonianus]KAG2125332.1 hypothetical protein DEU56DRAFT_916618 [Suillus clintonianus]